MTFHGCGGRPGAICFAACSIRAYTLRRLKALRRGAQAIEEGQERHGLAGRDLGLAASKAFEPSSGRRAAIGAVRHSMSIGVQQTGFHPKRLSDRAAEIRETSSATQPSRTTTPRSAPSARVASGSRSQSESIPSLS